MTPTVFREHGFRFFFFSREESRVHVHVHHPNGEAKFWLEPNIELAQNIGLDDRQVRQIQKLIEAHKDEIRESWKQHFRS